MFGFSWILITDGLTHVQMCMESHPGQSAVSNLYHSFRNRIRVRAQNISTWPSVKIAVAIEIMNILLFRWLIHVVRTHFFYFIFTHFIRSICQLSPKRKSKKKNAQIMASKTYLRLWIGAFVSCQHDVGNRWEYISNVFQSAVQYRSMETGHFSFSSFLFSFDPPNAWHKMDIFFIVVVAMDDGLVVTNLRCNSVMFRCQLAQSNVLGSKHHRHVIRFEAFSAFFVVEKGRKSSRIWQKNGNGSVNSDSVPSDTTDGQLYVFSLVWHFNQRFRFH